MTIGEILVLGFILIQTDADQEKVVLDLLNGLDEIEEAHFLFGEYDLIAKIEARDFKEVSNIVLKKIRSIDGVIETETLPGISF
jgi:DNA-binding Lrp family transcriptional regulator